MMTEFQLEGLQNGSAVGYGQDTAAPRAMRSFFRLIDFFFVLAFVIEWLSHQALDRCEFHRDITNWFDTVLVFVGVVDSWLHQKTRLAQLGNQLWHSKPFGNRYTLMIKWVRVLKSLRAVRMVRSLRLFRGLRLLVRACQCFLPSLCWAMVLLGIMMTMGALLLGNLLQVSEIEAFITDEMVDFEDRRWIWERYGTAYRASYTLFEITFAGSWPTLTRPVMAKVSDAFVIFFAPLGAFHVQLLVVVFMCMCALRKDTLEAAQNDAEQLVIDRLRMKQQFVQKLEGIFNSIDEHRDGLITEEPGDEYSERLTAILAIPRVEAYFQTMDLDVREGTSATGPNGSAEGVARVKGM
eukprot:Skav232147  [mRNA]  locus=scaffold1040:44726:66546:- [translate_table: standard]